MYRNVVWLDLQNIRRADSMMIHVYSKYALIGSLNLPLEGVAKEGQQVCL